MRIVPGAIAGQRFSEAKAGATMAASLVLGRRQNYTARQFVGLRQDTSID